jgi:hypothetical protein
MIYKNLHKATLSIKMFSHLNINDNINLFRQDCLQIAVFWDVATCSYVEIDRRLFPPSSGRWSRYITLSLPDDSGSKHLWNVGEFLREQMVQHPKSQSCSYHPTETEISQFFFLLFNLPQMKNVNKMLIVVFWVVTTCGRWNLVWLYHSQFDLSCFPRETA